MLDEVHHKHARRLLMAIRCRLPKKEPHISHETQMMKCLYLPLHALPADLPAHHQRQLMLPQAACLVLRKVLVLKHQMQTPSGIPARHPVCCAATYKVQGQQFCTTQWALTACTALLLHASSVSSLLAADAFMKRWHAAGRSRKGELGCSMHTWHQTTSL